MTPVQGHPCPFCPLLLPGQQELHNPIQRGVLIEGLPACSSCALFASYCPELVQDLLRARAERRKDSCVTVALRLALLTTVGLFLAVVWNTYTGPEQIYSIIITVIVGVFVAFLFFFSRQ